MKDRIDVLASSDKERDLVFTKAMLSEEEDEELSSIVQEAARTLNTPIALVNLVLNEIQFFKAHTGLPIDLRATQATSRDVSFCQHVVHLESSIKVIDTQEDARIPQFLVNKYGIRSYLGVPLTLDQQIVGSLCVIDYEPRNFSQDDRTVLESLAKKANTRLQSLNEGGSKHKLALLEKSAIPALEEIQSSILPIQSEASRGHVALAELKAFIRQAEYVLNSDSAPPKTIRGNLEKARKALEKCENYFTNIEMSAGDIGDSLLALEHVFTHSPRTQISDVALSGRELCRRTYRQIGGVYLPEIENDVLISTPRPIAVALVAQCISIVASLIEEDQSKARIMMDVLDHPEGAAISIGTENMQSERLEEVARELLDYLDPDPKVQILARERDILLVFPIL